MKICSKIFFSSQREFLVFLQILILIQCPRKNYVVISLRVSREDSPRFYHLETNHLINYVFREEDTMKLTFMRHFKIFVKPLERNNQENDNVYCCVVSASIF